MLKRLLLLIFFITNSLISISQVNVSLNIKEILADSWMEFETPTLNSIQVLYIEVRTYPKDGSRPFYPTQRYDENFCRQWISYAQTRQNWQTIPSGFYYKTFQINDHYNSEYKSEIFIKMKGFQKKELQNQCECNDYPKWDWGKNCSNILGKKVCLGGWSWGLDKFCDQEYDVILTIDENTKPYISHESGQKKSGNGRYGANFSYHITAPPTLAPKPGTIDLPNSYNFLGTDAKITQETVCTGEPLSLTATGGFEGVRGYRWFINGNFFTYTPVQTGTREAVYTFFRSNNSNSDLKEEFSTEAVYRNEFTNLDVVTGRGPGKAIYIHPPRPVIETIETHYMSCHDSKDNFVTIKANSVNGVSEYRYSIKPIDNSSAPLNKNGANATFTGADGLQGNDNPPLYLQYLVVAENIIYNSQVGGGTKTMYTCPSKIDTFSMRNPSQLQILNLDVIEYNNNAQIQCNGYDNGRIEVIARGGTSPYVYSYDNFNNTKSEIRFNNLKPDTTYTFSVRDNNGCETSRSTILTEPEPLKATRIPNIYSDYFNIRCKGESDGVITFDNVTGGTGPYRYSITGDAPYYSNNTFTGLIKGFYNLTVVDTNDCIYNDTLTLIEPTQLVLDSILTKQPDCFGYNDGMIQMVADGGVTHLPYTFSIDNYSNPYTKIPVNPAYYNDSATFTGLTTFNYNFTVEDANGCSANKFIFLNQPKDIQITFDASNVICSGDANGELYAFVSGGTKPYYYTWTGGSLDIEKSPSDSIVKNLNSDNYKLILTDAKGCNSVKLANVLEPMPLWANVNKVVQATCYDASDASIEIISGGGYTPHYYSINGSPFIAHRNFFDTLSAGSYVITVRDAAGCEITLPAIEIAKPNALSAQAIVKDVTCSYKSDGMVTLTASGGNGNYQYAYGWDGSFSNLKTFYNLKSGWHLIRIKDEKNCVLDKDIYIGSPDELQLTNISTTDATCGESNGSAIVQAFGGTAPYKYTWMNQNAEGNSIVNLPMGVHPIVVTDAKRCKDTLEVGISDESGPVVNIASLTIPSCFDSDNGSVTVEVQGGNAGHTFQWYDENRQTGTTASNLKDGSYLVKVTNASNCGTVKTIVIDAPEEQKIIVDQVTPSLCYGACNGEIGVYATGGTEPYSYIWDAPGQPTGALINNLCEGKYTVTLTDANGCIATQLIDLVNPAQMQIAIEDNMNLCTDQSIMLDAGNEGSTYTWLSFNGFKSNEQRVTISAPGNYNLTIVNENGCKLSKDFTVQVIEDLLDANFLVQGSSIVGDTIVFVEVSLPRPDRIEWKFTDNVTVKRLIGPYAFVNYPSPGTYLVNLTAYLGSCVDVVQKEVTIYNPEDYPGRLSSEKSRQGIIKVKVFPVPNQGEFTTQVTLGVAEPITISLHDVLGNLVSKSYKTNSSFYTENFKLPFNAIQEGIYILRVETATDVRVEKVMIVK